MEFESKLKCLSIFVTFGHHFTKPLGLQKFALSVVIGLKNQIFAALETWSMSKCEKIGMQLSFDPNSTVELEAFFYKKLGRPSAPLSIKLPFHLL